MLSINKKSKHSPVFLIVSIVYIIIITLYIDYIKKIVSSYKTIGIRFNNNLLISFILYLIIMIYLYINMIIIKCFI